MVYMEMHERHKGPLTDGTSQRIIEREYTSDWERSVARRAKERWVSLLKSTIRHPTPHYWNQIDAIPRGTGWTVWDRMVIYGPWLEGTGSRNRTTRFKGYFNFRKMTTIMGIESTIIGNRLLEAYISRIQ